MICEFPVLDNGFVVLEQTCAEDLDVVNAARVSLHQHDAELTERGKGLIGFLMREHHGTPFEHNFFKFRIRAPIFVFREWQRHRVGHSYNEWSARYSEMDGRFYVPEPAQVFVQRGKPGAYTYGPADLQVAEWWRAQLRHQCQASVNLYREALELGIAKQTARDVLHVNVYSEMYWSGNARSLMHWMALRAHPAAQWQIQQYAAIVESIFGGIMPITYAAWIENGRRAP